MRFSDMKQKRNYSFLTSRSIAKTSYTIRSSGVLLQTGRVFLMTFIVGVNSYMEVSNETSDAIRNNFIQRKPISSAVDQELHRKTQGTWRNYENSIGQSRGGYRVFQKGGLRPAIRNAGGGGGGGGCAVRFRPDTKSGVGGGGAARFRPDTKSGGRGCCPLQARYEKRGEGVLSASGPIRKAGKGEGLFSRRGGVTIYERGGCNPQTPPPWIRLCSHKYVLSFN